MSVLRPSRSVVESYLPGLMLATVVAVGAEWAARFAPLAGAPVLAIVVGILVGSVLPASASVGAGLRFSAKYVLQTAIVISGFAVSLGTVVHTGLGTLPVTLATIATALVLAAVLGRILNLSGSLKTLIGVGTAICGASAIAAVSTVLVPAEGDLAVAMATIFFYNITAVLTFPAIGHLLHLSQSAFGVWAGTAVNDTSSVVAAGYAYGPDAGAYATVVKLTRATLILPVVAGVAIVEARKHRRSGNGISWRNIVPWFIVWFLAATLINLTGIVPADAHAAITTASTFLICVALAAIGLQTRLRVLLAAGFRPLLFGALLWIAVAAMSLAVQRAAGS